MRSAALSPTTPRPVPSSSLARSATGVGTGEFARLVPRDPTEARGGDATAGDNSGSAEASGPSRPHQQHHLQQQLLEDLSTPAGKSSLPGAGVPFVEDSEEATDECGGGGGRGLDADSGKRGGGGGGVRGAGRILSVFEAKALEKARARQRDRMEAGEPQVSRMCHVRSDRRGGRG